MLRGFCWNVHAQMKSKIQTRPSRSPELFEPTVPASSASTPQESRHGSELVLRAILEEAFLYRRDCPHCALTGYERTHQPSFVTHSPPLPEEMRLLLVSASSRL